MEWKAVLLTGYSGKKEGFGAVCLSRNQENHEPYEWLEGWCNAVLKRARGATAKCNVDDKWRVETRCQNDGTAEGNDMIVRWTRRMFAVLRFPPSIRGGALLFALNRPGPSSLFFFSFLSLFSFLFFYIYTHAAIGNFTPWFDQFNFHHYHRRQFEGAVVIPDSSTSSVFARCSHLFPLALVSSTWSSKRRARLAVIIDRGEWRC